MLLRKYLKGGIVKEVRQYDFDRIIELQISKEDEYSLIIELFAPGNIILLDKEGRIILPLKRKFWSDRKISSKETYKHPSKKGINPLKINKENLSEIFTNSDTDIIRTLARSGLGGIYAEEIMNRSKVQKDLYAADISSEDFNFIINAIYELFNPLKTFQFNPQIVKNDKEDVIPIDLKIYDNYEKRFFNNFNEAADEFYSSKVKDDIKKGEEDIWKAGIKRLENRLRIQNETLKKFEKTVENSKKTGDMLYANYQLIQQILDTISNARTKYSWKEIIQILLNAKKEGISGAENIESIDKTGTLVLKIEGELIRLNSLQSIPENAEIYYNKAKKSKKKIKGVKIATEKTRKEIDEIKTKKEIALEKIKIPQKRVKKELKWYEKFRWFLSSDGLLVIAGRDATTNEILVKKYLEDNDIYLHSDIHGAPSVVIKSEDKEISQDSIIEAASFAASFSSAWNKGFGSLDVYWVNPDQVSKTPKSGEFVAKGAFIIRGTRNFIRGAPLLIGIGIVDYEGMRIMAGPPAAVKKYTNNYVVVKPGYTKKEVLARKILNKIDKDNILTLEDVIRVLPSGKGEIVENN
jgi:predicted ribosome quality control (RQC) complex YloA/Tae2 family protein